MRSFVSKYRWDILMYLAAAVWIVMMAFSKAADALISGSPAGVVFGIAGALLFAANGWLFHKAAGRRKKERRRSLL